MIPTFILSSEFVKISSIIPEAFWNKLFEIAWEERDETVISSINVPWYNKEIACFLQGKKGLKYCKNRNNLKYFEIG